MFVYVVKRALGTKIPPAHTVFDVGPRCTCGYFPHETYIRVIVESVRDHDTNLSSQDSSLHTEDKSIETPTLKRRGTDNVEHLTGLPTTIFGEKVQPKGKRHTQSKKEGFSMNMTLPIDSTCITKTEERSGIYCTTEGMPHLHDNSPYKLGRK